MIIVVIEGFCVGVGVVFLLVLDFWVCVEDLFFYVLEIECGMNMSW